HRAEWKVHRVESEAHRGKQSTCPVDLEVCVGELEMHRRESDAQSAEPVARRVYRDSLRSKPETHDENLEACSGTWSRTTRTWRVIRQRPSRTKRPLRAIRKRRRRARRT